MVILALGIVIFIMIPSAVFYHIEVDWTYLDSVYYAFISLATIGFGDLTNWHNTTEAEESLGWWMWAYKAFIMLWLIFGLGFVSWINNIIAEKIWKRESYRNFRRYSLTPSIMPRLSVINEEVGNNVEVTTQTTTYDLLRRSPRIARGVADALMKKNKSTITRRRTDPCMLQIKP